MRHKALLFLFVILAVSVSAQKPAHAPDALEANLRKHVEYLASDKLEGRRTGEKGATSAAGYVANGFANARLTPGFKNAKGKGNFLQPFPYIAGVGPGKDNFLRIIPGEKGNEDKLEAGVNFQPFGNSINGDVAPAPLVFAGYGITTADKKYDDYGGIDAGGKIVLAFDGVPDSVAREQAGGLNIHGKANFAKERGAKALILIARTENFLSDPLARLSYEPTIGETSIPVVVISRQIAAALFGKPVAEIASQSAEMRAAGSVPLATAQLKVDLVKKTAEAYNVIGIVEGTDPVLKSEAIVIGAHYDHLGRGGAGSLAANSTEIHHGADDNASGTAAILELARQFARDKKNKRTLIFMAFGGEEEGLLGSKYYVNNPVWPLDKTVAMINLDMVGRLNEGKLTVGGIGTATEMKALVEGKNQIASFIDQRSAAKATQNFVGQALTSIPVFSLQLNEDGFGPSDHSSFYGKQIPVLFFFTGTHLDYHKPTDTFEKINYDGLIKITNYVAAITRSIDENPTRPTYKVAQSAGMGGRMTFNVSLGTIPSYAEGNDGLTIDGVRDASPAAKAGLKGGDTIIKLAGKDVRNISDYMFALGAMKAGEEYEVTIKRGTETLTLKIIPAPAARR